MEENMLRQNNRRGFSMLAMLIAVLIARTN
jgi:Tfp pilus assembly protein PilV